jgi:uncharacterized protein
MSLIDIFWNSHEKRLRAFWRLAIQVIIVFLLTVIFSFVSAIFLIIFTSIDISETSFSLGQNAIAILVSGMVFIIAPVLGVVFIDRRSKTSFGFSFTNQWWKDLGFGLLLGALLMTIIFLIEYAFGWVTIKGFLRQEGGDYAFIWGFLIVIIQFLFVGIYEETFFRGYLMLNLAEGLSFIKYRKTGVFLAYFLSSSLFGVMHALNPHTTLISTINIALAGLFLGLGFILTGNIAISIGLHITWNFFQGNIFGFAVSGTNNVISVIDSVQGGHVLITGGEFGPEAGIIGIFAMALGSVLTYLWVKWQYGKVQLGILDNFFQVKSDKGETPPVQEITTEV